ncbi:hypothetical protein I302_108454 [Kwoniella bestiolae CBS 10118]|uniref:Hyaluronan-mediated motility receptor C-terminal domain-containing protein n=1 Tax=Kwoniella bestiolae CBS 10118 TaxID=1296100 RepID=A0A1B9FVM2_9TREE|nr:hypothetical protein I302_07172 [Kwoniella bestiolae CBS 10118]OCF22827.1 hypothetical protein I302_07172 [Kwoniella bestiolae CBS 10118]
MATTHRKPLGTSTANNVHPEKTKHHDAEYHLRKAQSNIHEEKRKRAEAEGSAEGWKRDLNLSKKEVESLRKDLERAKAKITRRDETIKSLESKATTIESPNTELEKKLKDLVERHHSSKAKYHTQISALQLENKTIKDLLTTRAGEIEDLQAKQHVLEAENRHLATQVETLKSNTVEQNHLNHISSSTARKEIREHENERTEWKVEKHRLERHFTRLEGEMEILKSTISRDKQREERSNSKKGELNVKNRELEEAVQDLREDLKELNEVQAEKERLECLLQAASTSYRVLYRDSVLKDRYHQLQVRLFESQSDACLWQEKAERLERKVHFHKEIIRDLQDQLKISKEERKMLKKAAEDLSQDRHTLREELSSFATCYTPSEVIQPLQPLPILPAMDIATTHNNLSTSHLTYQLNTVRQEHSDLLQEYEKTRESLVSSSTTLNALQRSFAELKSSHQSLEEEHGPCSGMIAELQLDLTNTRSEIAELTQEVKVACEERDTSNKQAKDDREALKRANDSVMRSKMAEEALDEEVKHLQEAYTEAAKYEDLYHDLKEQYDILEAREAAAVDEAERLGLENAELVGHNNEGQKINYVEGVRREMVLLKQELASTRHLLNVSNDKIVKLEHEIQAYTSIDLHSNQMGLGMLRTKVTRRQPENGRLTVSRNAIGAGKGRSVSGPVWR